MRIIIIRLLFVYEEGHAVQKFKNSLKRVNHIVAYIIKLGLRIPAMVGHNIFFDVIWFLNVLILYLYVKFGCIGYDAKELILTKHSWVC